MDRQRASVASGPPTMMDSVPAMAPLSPPLTGASSISMPASPNRPAMRRVTAGEMVDMSITTSPGRPASTMPPGPRATCSTSGESDTMVMTTSERSATSRGQEASTALSLTSSSMPGRLRFHTVSEYPAFSRLRAIGRPIMPSPMKPMRSAMSSSCRCQACEWP